ncbi:MULTISPECIES: phage tail length tape measure family protein [Stenotrophomonas]|uniref:phage tail length tape measure family protein n=1 Tax=Stenotrophomonas TaxID=40323 RepID=UPI0015DE53CB|nr:MULTISPECIES: phage tail length tape measure family protein [Stenotrophomonas]MBA0430606.1 Laminin subunit alpha-2 [Stenotrophomonas maltophilia]MDH0274830.1 phage tail length tape measure family protein [Stenotrophomonas sp. GD04089]MDH1913313.1 phage tail length tape measure family protein [Stenotrophomonas sp. GD03794]
MADRLEEAIRVVIETQGREGVEELRAAFGDLGDVSVETAGKASKLLDSLTGLNAAAAKADAFDGMLTDLAELERQFGDNQKAALSLSLSIGEMEKPSREVLAAQRDLRKEGERLKKALNEQWDAVGKADDELASLGVNTANLADHQQRLRIEATRSAAALTEQARAAAAEAEAGRRRKQQVEEGEAAFRKQATTSKAAAKALAEYQERTADAAAGSSDLATATESTVSWFGKLKAVAAGAIAFVGLNRVVDGIKAIVKEGSDAEQELAQLEAALHATGRTSEFTAQSLAAMRQQLQSGLFDDGQISAAQVRLLSYTNIVGEQFPAAMQITIDQAQRLGMSLEQSAEVVGKALQTPSKAMESLSKQGFTLDDSQKALIKSLEATGQVAQAQSIILDLLAESYGGAAAAAKVGTIAGLWKAATDRFKDWKQEVADQGVLTYFKDQLNTLLATLDRLAADGSLSRWAKQTAQAIITMAEAVKGTTQWVVDHARVIGLMAAAYAQFKLVGAILQLNAWRVALLASTRAQLANNAAVAAGSAGLGRFGALLRGLPKAVPIAVTLLGLEAAIGGLDVLKTVAQDIWKQHDPALKRAGDAQRAYISQVRDSALELRRQALSFVSYRDVVVKTAEDVTRMAAAEREAYAARLAGLEQYLTAQEGFLLMQQKAGVATAAQLQELGLVTQQLLLVSTGYAALSRGVNLAADAIRNGIGGAAQLVVDQLQGIDRNARLATDSIGKILQGLNFADTGSLDAVGTALGFIASQGAAAERNVRDGLLESLQRLSGEELARFQAAAQAAFDSLPQGAANSAAVLETTLLSAMEKLSVSASRLGVSFTVVGRDAIAAFGAVAESAVATSSQIEEAFKAALGKVATLDEARTLGALLEAAGRRGKVGFDAAERSAAALNARLRDIQVSLDPLADEFARLGIQSQQSLNAARDSAKAAFEAIQRGASQGKASIEDVRRAFDAYAAAARAAVADSDDWKRKQVNSQLEVQGSVLQTGQHMKGLGVTGQSAMQQVQSGAQAGTQAMGQLTQKTAEAGGEMEGLGQSAERSGQQLQKAGKAAQSMAFSIGEVSEAALSAMRNLSGPNPLQQFANALNKVTSQRKQLAEYKKELEELSNAQDEFSSSATSRLGSKYDYLGKQEIAEVAALEAQVARKRAEEDRAAQQAAEDRRKAAMAEAEAQAKADASRIQAGDTKEQVLTIDWKAPSKEVVAGATAAEIQQAERIAGLVAPIVLRKIERSRAVSVRGTR